MDVLRGALTNLGKYNEGGLDYVWVPFRVMRTTSKTVWRR